MSSEDVKIIVEHYINGGFSVISENFNEMGLTKIYEVTEAMNNIMLKELGLLKLIEEDKT